MCNLSFIYTPIPHWERLKRFFTLESVRKNSIYIFKIRVKLLKRYTSIYFFNISLLPLWYKWRNLWASLATNPQTMLVNLYYVDLCQPKDGKMLKIYIKMWLFYNFIRFLKIYALFLQTDSGQNARLSLSRRGLACVWGQITHYI